LDRDDSPVEKLITRQLGISEAIECGFYAIKNGEDVMKIIINLEK
jgi:hypothetical protein